MPLDTIEQALLEQTYRFGMGTPELGTLVPEIRNDSQTALDVLDALSAKNYLGQAPLYGKLHYYFLAQRAHHEFELEQCEIGPLKEREKTQRFAMLRLALESKPPYRPLTVTDFRDHFSELYYASPNGTTQRKQEPRFRDYYLAGSRLGHLVVDSAGTGRYDRILKKACRQIGTHLAMPPYAQLIRSAAFETTIVTAFQSKATRLKADLTNLSTDAPIKIHVVTEIREFIAPPKLNHM